MRPAFASLILYLVSAAQAQKSAHKPIVLGCYPSWVEGHAPASSLPYPYLTHVAHCFLLADEEGNIRGEGSVPSKSVVEAGRPSGAKTTLALGGWGSAKYYGPMVKNPKAVQNHVRQVLKVVEEHGYDGVDLDWEFPEGEEEHRAFVDFCALFKKELTLLGKKTGKTYTVSSAVNPGAWAGRLMDGPALAEAVDYLMVMTYDYTGPWDDWAGHHASLFPSSKDSRSQNGNVRAGLEYWNKEKKIPKEKLLVGIPLYARGFKTGEPFVTIPRGQNSEISGIAYKDLPALMAKGWTSRRDPESRVPWLYAPDKSAVIGYDDAESAAEKGRWAKDQGYGGIFFWSLDQDLMGDGGHPLVEAAAKAFR